MKVKNVGKGQKCYSFYVCLAWEWWKVQKSYIYKSHIIMLFVNFLKKEYKNTNIYIYIDIYISIYLYIKRERE